ncbi:hypothetical protein [uncultured Tessaracoccus sp.]|uniref:hypothetical protein n=1 Tax=uncultured Tessaracoccus sp. TaxID=905023 RepID=UPI002624A442|nr:hypothetical protein [uncultured Tessaracoccus sp.]
MEIDLTTVSDDELDALRRYVLTELERRNVLATAQQQAEQLAKRWADASGRHDGGPWRQPQAAFDAYPLGAVVVHNGKTWESTTPINVWEPGVSGWREQAGIDPETGEQAVPAYRPPTGGHDAYEKGGRVTWGGSV